MMTWIDNNIAAAGDTVLNGNDREIHIYPDPAGTNINLSFYLSSAIKSAVQISDLTGRILYVRTRHPVINGCISERLDVSHLLARYYILRIIQDRKVI